MGFFAGLNDEKYDRQYKDNELVRRMISYFGSQKARLAFASVVILVIAIIGAALPVIVSRMVDLIKEQPGVGQILLVGAALVGVAFGQWGLNWLRRGLIVRAVGDVVLDMRSRAFRAAAEHDLSFYDQFSSGRIVSRITSDTNDFGQLVVIVTDVVAQIIQAALIAVVLFRTELRLSLLLIGFLPVIFAIAAGFRAMARRVTKKGMKAMSDVNAAIKETISGISIAKNFRQEEGIFKSFDESNQQSYSVNVQRGFVLSLVFPTLNALSGIFVGILIYVGGNSAAADADPNVVQTEKQDVPRLKGGIHFDHMHFRYSDKEPVLSDFNLIVRPGETLALVGHTGAGKSSIAKLIARFYEYQQGRLLIDGRDIRAFDLTQYRRQLGIVSQVPFLFSGTVADNIRYAAPGAPEDEMLRLAKRIGDGEWLDALPNGLHTEVGERGNRLSMGQRQLVALMRVLVQNPAIFILDEATASIDPFTEWQIQQALNLILKNSTSILIAHRLSTVKAADRIVVMRKGTIIEEGNHQGLLDQNGHYAELYNTYFRHQSLAYVEQVKEMVGK
ncbi:MAG: ABC transporter ATP-binding protein [Chloroflexi bacterium]|nr:ABC transporter ATP-binding protein [Chloroflexota bacterium]